MIFFRGGGGSRNNNANLLVQFFTCELSLISLSISPPQQNSNVTMPVMSPDFLQADYSEYGVQMALCEMLFERRPCVHILWYQGQDISHKRLPRELMSVLRDNRYTEYPPADAIENMELRRNFWDDVSSVIRHTTSTSRPNLLLNDDRDDNSC